MNTNTWMARKVGALILLATITYATGNGLISSILDHSDSLRNVDANQTRVISGIVLSISRLHSFVLPKTAELFLASKQHLTGLGRQNSA
jgi:hypothetical protein